MAEWLPTLSVILVAAALLASIWQVRVAQRQTRAVVGDLLNGMNTYLVGTHTTTRLGLMADDPEMLRWYLVSRGYHVSTPLHNKQRLYALMKLETHETTYLAQLRGQMEQSYWQSWLRVLEVDLTVPIYIEVWQNAEQFYSLPFVELVRSILKQNEVSGQEG